MNTIKLGMAALVLSSLILTGCAGKPKTLYQWEGYQTNVDAYLRAEKSPHKLAHTMENDLRKIRASGGLVPPGFYAHLGLLYGQQGNLDKFAEMMKAEKNLYPESEKFVDFLLRNFKK